jgi:hypothetical protein
LTVTGTASAVPPPAPFTTAAITRPMSSGRAGSAEPPPRAVTLRTGQPMLMSMWCTPTSVAR